jgi:hypothetical protein
MINLDVDPVAVLSEIALLAAVLESSISSTTSLFSLVDVVDDCNVERMERRDDNVDEDMIEEIVEEDGVTNARTVSTSQHKNCIATRKEMQGSSIFLRFELCLSCDDVDAFIVVVVVVSSTIILNSSIMQGIQC